MHYIVDGYANPDVALPYLRRKIPKAIEITTQKFIIPKTREFILENDEYTRFHRVNDDTVLLLSLLKKYHYKDMFEMIESFGFNDRIPEDMIKLYQGENEDVKRLKKVADTYRKNTNL